jgi:hypothetical protein
MPPRPWKTISSPIVYQIPWTKVGEDFAEMPDGKQTIYGIIECRDAVGVLPFLDSEQVILVRQYRYVFDESHRWEMPTSGLKPGEIRQQAAR